MSGDAEPPLIEVRRLEAGYGRARILDGLEFTVAAGESVALIGPNGSGKSTTFKALAGLLEQRRGSVRLAGTELIRRPAHAIARLGLGYVPEERRIFTRLTVAENLAVARQAPRPGLAPWTPERLFRLFPPLAGLQRRQGGEISGGEQQMLAIARALMGNPRLLLLDEPGEGLAPKIVDQLIDALVALRGQGLTLLLAEPDPGFARAVASRALRLERGRLVAEGSVAAVMDDPG